MKKVFFSFLLILFSTLVALLIGELTIRILYKEKIVLFPRYFTDRWYGEYHLRGMRPSMRFTHTSADGQFHFETNSQGFRNREEISYQKSEGEIRVLVVGDSHTFGYEVNQEETYAAVTQQLLRKQGVNASVINAGLSGTGTAEQLVFLEQEGFKYQPDYVVLGFFSNDFDDNLKSGFFAVNADTLISKNREHIPGVRLQNFIYQFAVIRWLSENSYLYNFAFNTIWDFFKNRSLQKGREIQIESVLGKEGTIDGQSQQLEQLLLKRLKKQSVGKCKLIFLDIPTLNGMSSLPAALLKDFRSCSDTLFYYPAIKLKAEKRGNTHVSHGQRHISASTHALFGEMIATYIAAGTKPIQAK